MSGKTVAARALYRQHAKRGRPVLVHDPVGVPSDWPGARVVRTGDELMQYAFQADMRGGVVVIDEAGDVARKANSPLMPLATRGRHHGLSTIWVAQRYTMVWPTIRAQCTTLIAYATGPKDSAAMAEEWDCKTLLSALPPYHAHTVRQAGGRATHGVVMFRLS